MMSLKGLVTGIVVIFIGFFIYTQNQKTYAPVTFNGETYSHVETTDANNVVNHFFTPGGVELPASGKFLQIADFSHPDITERHVKVIRQQLSATMSLKPLKPGSDRYFGMYRNKHPIYAIEKGSVYVIYSIEEGFEGDEESLRSQADKIIDVLDEIPVPY